MKDKEYFVFHTNEQCKCIFFEWIIIIIYIFFYPSFVLMTRL